MINSVNDLLKDHKNEKIVVSVSGGVDSLVLFFILLNLGYDLVLVHFNHQKRDNSILEADYLKTLCEELNVPFEYFILDIKKDFHNEAHHLRKKYLTEVATKYNTNIILTAHHANDLLESILLKIARGSNLVGYAGLTHKYIKDGY